MNKLLITIAISSTALISGCATAPAAIISAGSMAARAAQSTAVPPSGKTVTVEKYQFFPDAPAMAALCKAKLETEVGPLNDRPMKIEHSRNMLLGVSRCVASL
jgi:hypothetical protein